MRGMSKPARREVLRAFAGASVTTVLAAAGLVASTSAFAQAVAASPDAFHTLHIVDGRVPPDEQLIEAHKGDRLRLRVTSNLAGELHLHAYRLSLLLAPDQSAELTFAAFATGRFRLEFHPKARGTSTEAHDAAPLATLEVRPS